MAEKRTKKSAATEEKRNASDARAGAGASKLRIQYYRSFIAAPKTHKQMVRSLGLTKLNQIVERPDNASSRGAVAKIPHLLRIVK
ncbi:MAG TPA: 50S ribosomal protein L30 [Pyrinomonadaceae bacterium]|nr:50S ribosomal protein L30 [Pyrinomonadaceae bacterium]